MMQSITLSSGSTGMRTPGGVPPLNHHSATGIDLSGTQAAAEILALRLIHAWAIQGHGIEAWVVKQPNPSHRDGHGEQASWVVRSDLVNGMPSGLGRWEWERKFGRGI